MAIGLVSRPDVFHEETVGQDLKKKRWPTRAWIALGNAGTLTWRGRIAVLPPPPIIEPRYHRRQFFIIGPKSTAAEESPSFVNASY